MSKFVITVLEGPERYSRETPQKEAPVQIEANSFKINDQGTIIFIGRSGDAVAAFKHWRDVKPLAEGGTITSAAVQSRPYTVSTATPAGPYVDLDPRGEPRFPLR